MNIQLAQDQALEWLDNPIYTECYVINLDYYSLEDALNKSELQLQHLTDGWNIKRYDRERFMRLDNVGANVLIRYF